MTTAARIYEDPEVGLLPYLTASLGAEFNDSSGFILRPWTFNEPQNAGYMIRAAPTEFETDYDMGTTHQQVAKDQVMVGLILIGQVNQRVVIDFRNRMDYHIKCWYEGVGETNGPPLTAIEGIPPLVTQDDQISAGMPNAWVGLVIRQFTIQYCVDAPT